MESVIRRLRLGSGRVMFAYVTPHFLNHSPGLFSVDATCLASGARRGLARSPGR
jgi:hypothetical protein